MCYRSPTYAVFVLSGNILIVWHHWAVCLFAKVQAIQENHMIFSPIFSWVKICNMNRESIHQRKNWKMEKKKISVPKIKHGNKLKSNFGYVVSLEWSSLSIVIYVLLQPHLLRFCLISNIIFFSCFWERAVCLNGFSDHCIFVYPYY